MDTEGADRMSRLLAAKAYGELCRYAGNSESTLAKLFEEESFSGESSAARVWQVVGMWPDFKGSIAYSSWLVASSSPSLLGTRASDSMTIEASPYWES